MSRLPAREADAEKLLACCAGVGVEMRLEEAVVVEEGKVDVRERREVMRDGCCWKRREENVRDVIVCDTNGSLETCGRAVAAVVVALTAEGSALQHRRQSMFLEFLNNVGSSRTGQELN